MKRILVPTGTIQKAVGQSISAGCPSLSPAERYLKERNEIAKLEHDTAIAEGFRNVQFGTQDDNGMPVDVLEARLGKMLNSNEIEKRLLKLNPNLVFIVPPADPTKVSVNIVDKSTREGYRFLCGMERGYTPEFTVVHKKWTKRLVKTGHNPRWEMIPEYAGEKRGWRSVLVRLIRMRVINRTAAEKVFGLPSYESSRWTEALNAD